MADTTELPEAVVDRAIKVYCDTESGDMRDMMRSALGVAVTFERARCFQIILEEMGKLMTPEQRKFCRQQAAPGIPS